MRRCNAKIRSGKGENAAEKIWGICKELGATYIGVDDEMVNFVEEFENRDKLGNMALGDNNSFS